VVADIRRGSPTFGKWISVALSADNARQIYVPPGYSHGICVTSDYAAITYKVTDFYDPSDELRIAWNDPDLAIRWPFKEPLLSDKDLAAKPVRELTELLPVYQR
jgi:dTDP-4-dehydrorhamnose 3,5-epimerase